MINISISIIHPINNIHHIKKGKNTFKKRGGLEGLANHEIGMIFKEKQKGAFFVLESIS